MSVRENLQFTVSLDHPVVHDIALYCMVLHGNTMMVLYCTIVGFGARAVSRKTPIYFIHFIHKLATVVLKILIQIFISQKSREEKVKHKQPVFLAVFSPPSSDFEELILIPMMSADLHLISNLPHPLQVHSSSQMTTKLPMFPLSRELPARLANSM